MQKSIRHVGLDVHAETIAVAVAEPEGEVRSLGTIPNRPDSVRKLMRNLGTPEKGSTTPLLCVHSGAGPEPRAGPGFG